MSEILETIETASVETTNSSVIWLHGLGADGSDFEPIVPQLNLPRDISIRFVFPHAPVQPVTVNSGMPMRAWYDIEGIGDGYSVDEPGIDRSVGLLNTLVEREIELGRPASRIVLAGFSQGGVIALHCALRCTHTLAGIMALSTYLPLQENFTDLVHEANHRTPIFMAHGSQDPLISDQFAFKSFQFLQNQGYSVDWKLYPMAHSVCAQEVSDISSWLEHVLTG